MSLCASHMYVYVFRGFGESLNQMNVTKYV